MTEKNNLKKIDDSICDEMSNIRHFVQKPDGCYLDQGLLKIILRESCHSSVIDGFLMKIGFEYDGMRYKIDLTEKNSEYIVFYKHNGEKAGKLNNALYQDNEFNEQKIIDLSKNNQNDSLASHAIVKISIGSNCQFYFSQDPNVETAPILDSQFKSLVYTKELLKFFGLDRYIELQFNENGEVIYSDKIAPYIEYIKEAIHKGMLPILPLIDDKSNEDGAASEAIAKEATATDKYLKFAAAGVVLLLVAGAWLYAKSSSKNVEDVLPSAFLPSSSPPPDGEGGKFYKIAYKATPELKFKFWFIKISESQAEADKRVEADLAQYCAKFNLIRGGESSLEHIEDYSDGLEFIGHCGVADLLFYNAC
jgi:hypothetical protein